MNSSFGSFPFGNPIDNENVQVNMVDSTLVNTNCVKKASQKRSVKPIRPNTKFDISLILNHKNRIDYKFNTMESANNLPTLYYNEPLDSKYVMVLKQKKKSPINSNCNQNAMNNLFKSLFDEKVVKFQPNQRESIAIDKNPSTSLHVKFEQNCNDLVYNQKNSYQMTNINLQQNKKKFLTTEICKVTSIVEVPINQFDLDECNNEYLKFNDLLNQSMMYTVNNDNNVDFVKRNQNSAKLNNQISFNSSEFPFF